METIHILISGRVQGVFFRDASRKMARQLGVTGWIRNRNDGKVEALVSGEEKEVAAFTQWCRSGPEKAEVEDVTVSRKEPTFFSEFEIKKGA